MYLNIFKFVFKTTNKLDKVAISKTIRGRREHAITCRSSQNEAPLIKFFASTHRLQDSSLLQWRLTLKIFNLSCLNLHLFKSASTRTSCGAKKKWIFIFRTSLGWDLWCEKNNGEDEGGAKVYTLCVHNSLIRDTLNMFFCINLMN